MSKGDVALAGKGVHRQCQLTKAQMETFITMRALAASPLMMGGDLPTYEGIHFNAEAQIVIGKRLTFAYKKISAP